MCGIAGVVDVTGAPVDRLTLRRMCDALRHRGPDDDGYHFGRGSGLGQRRLSIIDLGGGRQPMANEDGTVWVTFNGEIYNFRELRPQLEALGHRFATDSDTEVIVHAYEQYGADCVSRFRGMFAFALWDERNGELFLARDRLGKKPLYYAAAGPRFVFASELQGLLQHPDVSTEEDPTAVDDYLTYGYVPAPRTIYRNVYKLPPAHCLRLRTAGGPAAPRWETWRYWRLEYGPKLDLRDDEALDGLREVLEEAVRLRLIADVPLGVLLSGGLDSSLVVALMSRLSGRAVKTFSVGFGEARFNELPFARRVARHFGTEHHELVVRPEALDVLPALVRHYGEPFADSSAVPTYYVAQMTRRHVKVVLNGDGADEAFAGYERYRGSLLAERYQRLPRPLRAGLIEPLTRLIPPALSPFSRLRHVRNFVRAAGRPFAERYLGWLTYFGAEDRARLYQPEFARHLAGHDAAGWGLGLLREAMAAGDDPLDALLAADVQSYLPYDLLVKMDIATMANSVEGRSPFLDHKVLEFAARLPAAFKLRGATLKWLPKKLAGRLLPRGIAHRRKMGFGVSVGSWLRRDLRPLVEDLLLAPGAALHGYFRPDALRDLVAEHDAGRRDHAFQLWALLCFGLWRRECSRRPAAGPNRHPDYPGLAPEAKAVCG